MKWVIASNSGLSFMTVNSKTVLTQIDTLVEDYQTIIRQAEYGNYDNISGITAAEFLTRAAGVIERFAPVDSAYRQSISLTYQGYEHLYPGKINSYVGALKALRADYEAGTLRSITELVHADVFGDFLEMADYLLSEGYKDPAAVIAGTVLEGQLRKLCDKNSIPTHKTTGEPKKADAINAELAGANVYTKLDLKNVTAWLDLRNKAAHGHYAEYTKEQVALLIQSIRDFITRNPG